MQYDQKRIWRWEDVSPHFKPEEIFSPETIAYPHLVDVVALHQLNMFWELVERKYGPKKIFINHAGLRLRGVRSMNEQIRLKEVGGAVHSQHVQGKAFDKSCYDLDWKVFLRLCMDFWPFTKQYPDKNFIHVDNRNRITL